MSEENFSIDSLKTFGGLCTLVDRLGLPKGLSPNCQDVEFAPGIVRSRDGYGILLTISGSAFVWLKSFVRNAIRKLLILTGAGEFYVEYPEGQLSKLGLGYVDRDPLDPSNAYLQMQGDPFGERQTAAASRNGVGALPPLATDCVTPVTNKTIRRFTQSGPVQQLTLATSATAGSVPTGLYYAFYAFRSDTGYLSPAGGAQSLNQTTAARKIDVTAVQTGPPGTTARILAFTLPGGSITGPYYYIPGVTEIGDNTTVPAGGTELKLDFTASQLAAGEDVTELMEKVVMPPCSSIVRYGNRAVVLGVPNFLLPTQPSTLWGSFLSGNVLRFPTLYYSGAPSVPVGWTRVSGTDAFTVIDLVPGSGTPTDGGQPAFVGHIACTNVTTDEWTAVGGEGVTFSAKLGLRYRVGVRVRRASSVSGNTTLRVILKMVGGSGTIIADTGSVTVSTNTQTEWSTLWSSDALSVPAPIAGACNLKVVVVTASGATGWIELGEFYIQLMESGDPYSTAWISDGASPEDFYLTRSPLQISPGDGDKLRAAFMQSGNLYLLKDRSMWVVTDNADAPVTWSPEIISSVVGTYSPNGVALGNKFAIIAGRAGVYRFDGGMPDKLSQEIEPTWRLIDWTQAHRMWVSIDPEKQRVRIGAPMTTQYPWNTVIFEMDYVEGWDSGLLSGDGRGRKWSITNITSTHGTVIERDNRSSSFCISKKTTALNHVVNSTDFSFPGTWTVVSGGPTALSGQPDPFGGTGATSWYQNTSWKLKFTPSSPWFVAPTTSWIWTLWATVYAGPGQLKITVESYDGGSQLIGTSTTTVSVPSMTNSGVRMWSRLSVPFTVTAGAVSASLFVEETGGCGGGLLVGQGYQFYGHQIQPFTYDFGYQATTGTRMLSNNGSDGVISTPVSGQTYDHDAQISPTYETAPFGLDVAFATFGSAIARARGNGTLNMNWVRPDGTTLAVNSGQLMPTLTSAPRYDIETRSNEHELSLGLRLSMAAKDAYFFLRGVFVMLKPSAKGPRRGKTS